MIGFSNSRMMHSLSVARKMKFLAEKTIGFPHSPKDMFLLGLIHDASYEFVCCQEDHEQRGGEILRDNGYKYWREVYYHGNPDSEYCSRALTLLNYADMTTDQEGNDVSIEERLENIKERYGADSVQYLKAVRLSEILQGDPMICKISQ